MTIDEAIQHTKELLENNKDSDYYLQLIQWLQELKDLRQIITNCY